MSLTSYQAAPPRVLLETQVGSVLETRNQISELFQAARVVRRAPDPGDSTMPTLNYLRRIVGERSLDRIVKKEHL
jgi:hypothetical protein